MNKTTAIAILFTLLTFFDTAYAGTALDPLAKQRDAEMRKAVAEAERAELLAKLPLPTSKPLSGTIDVHQFGAAGLARAFDLAEQLATETCNALPAKPKTVIHEALTTQGILAARLVNDAITRFNEDLGRKNKELQQVIEAHTPQSTQASTIFLPALTTIPAIVRATADLSSLLKSDVSAEGLGYGSGARTLFVTSLAQRCPDKMAGLGTGYLGELDGKQYDDLLSKVRTLMARRGDFANQLAIVQKLVSGAKGSEKNDLTAVLSSGGAVLKTVDSFIDSLRVGEAGNDSPLFNAARYLAYAVRTDGLLVLDFDLRLEGMTIVKDNLFTGQHLRLSAVAFLLYRLHEPNGTLRLANAVRRISRPVDIDLRGQPADANFWDHPFE